MIRNSFLPSFLLSILALIGLVSVGVHAGDASAARGGSCGAGAAIVVPGTNAPRTASGVPSGGVNGIGKRYAAQGYRVQYVDYPTSLWPLGAISYNDDVALGKAATERAIADYQARCPGRPVVVSGYSQGARVAGDVISDAAHGRRSVSGRRVSTRGLSGELYSDPRRAGRNGYGGVENALIGLIPGMMMSGPRDGGFGAVAVRQICVQGDGVCDAPDPLTHPLGALDALSGYFFKHGDYPWRMGSAPVAGGPRWAGMRCRPQGRTLDCVVQKKSSAAMWRDDQREPWVRDAALPFVGAVENSRPFTLIPGLRLSTFRPLVGAGMDSSSGDLAVVSRGTVPLVDVDWTLTRRWGRVNDVTFGVGFGPAGFAGVGNWHLTIPLLDERRLLDVLLNPSNLMGTSAPPNAVAIAHAPRGEVSVRKTVPVGTATQPLSAVGSVVDASADAAGSTATPEPGVDIWSSGAGSVSPSEPGPGVRSAPAAPAFGSSTPAGGVVEPFVAPLVEPLVEAIEPVTDLIGLPSPRKIFDAGRVNPSATTTFDSAPGSATGK